jgi:hypothetical protein
MHITPPNVSADPANNVICCVLTNLGLYARSRKVVDSIPDVTGFFNWPNPSSRTMTLGSTQPLTEMSTRNLPRAKERPERKADLTPIYGPIV